MSIDVKKENSAMEVRKENSAISVHLRSGSMCFHLIPSCRIQETDVVFRVIVYEMFISEAYSNKKCLNFNF